MAQSLGIDLGTNSLGLNVYDKEVTGTLKDQIAFSVDSFKNGVKAGSSKSREASLAAERRTFRSARNRFRSGRARKQATLKHLIKHGYCPLDMESLNKWRFDDEEKGYNRTFPTDMPFMQWLNLNFNDNPDGRADYADVYQIRNELMTRKFDFSNVKDRYILGRAIYHIACHRGFRSSKGMKAGQAENENNEVVNSELSASKEITAYIEEKNLKTVGQAFHAIRLEGKRVRNSQYTAIRKQNMDEIKSIFEFQGLDMTSDFYIGLISLKKGEGTIFYNKPIRKGNKGKCFLEPQKPRCKDCHPEFEKFRALQLINNIRIKHSPDSDYVQLDESTRRDLYNELFIKKVRDYFYFSEIREYLQDKFNIQLSKDDNTINYKDSQSVAGCPVTARLLKLFGVCDMNCKINGTSYSIEDLWNVCSDSNVDEDWLLKDFAVDKLCLDDKQVKAVRALWNNMSDGYGNLSLKAIRKINVMLDLGFGYSDAVMLAKVPEIMGEDKFLELKDSFADLFDSFCDNYNELRNEITLKNEQTSNYFMEHPNESYKTSRRKYVAMPVKYDCLKDFLAEKFPYVYKWKWNRLYHHSDTSYYPVARPSKDGNTYLGNPVLGKIMPPSVKHSLFVLRKRINKMIKDGDIDVEHTRVVVETAREMCDANKKWAIDVYNAKREEEGRKIADMLKENCNLQSVSDEDVDKARLLLEQGEQSNSKMEKVGEYYSYSVSVEKVKLWKEQNYISVYTGNVIPFAKLFTDSYDIEHTLPISQSFDDSLANKTICEAEYNRKIKRNRLPVELDNYSESVTFHGFNGECKPIKESVVLRLWNERVERLTKQVVFWDKKAKSAAIEDDKNNCLKQKYLYQMELDYWSDKVKRFYVKEVDDSFRNSQLNDTRMITRYAYHYLKSVFPKVFVERGDTTARFRDILGIEKKDRTKHYHHAIDALVLSLIPNSKQRDEILRLHYAILEAKKLNDTQTVKTLKSKLDAQLRLANLNIKEIADAVKKIQKEIVIKHEVKDNKMVKNRKRTRIGGKVVKGSWQTGDVVKGSLVHDTLYGAIRLPIIGDNGLPEVKNGTFKYSDVTDNSDIDYVSKVELSKVKNLADIVDPYIRRSIEIQMEEYKIKNLSSVGEKPMWVLKFEKDANGNIKKDENGKEIYTKITKDRHGNALCPIRHVRCFVKDTIAPSVIKLKTTERTSEKRVVNLPNGERKYKQFVYAQKGDNVCCLVYSGMDAYGKCHNKYVFLNDMDIASLKRKYGPVADKSKDIRSFIRAVEELQNTMDTVDVKKVPTELQMSLKEVIIPGMALRLKTKENMNSEEISENTYIVRCFNYTHKSGDILVAHHIDASKEPKLKCMSPSSFDKYEVIE